MKNRMIHRNFGLSRLMVAALSLVPVIVIAAEDSNTQKAQEASKQEQPAPTGSSIARETSFPKIASGKWAGAKLSDGQPDIQGHWSNTISNHSNFTDPQGGIPNDPNPNRRAKGSRDERAPSRVSDPADGQVPFQPWAAAKVKEFQQGFHNPTDPRFIEPLARCAPGGIPKSFYWHGYEIAQYPGYVVFFFDSRGHWEGNTLVVDAANHNGKALFGRTGEFISENGHIQERYIFNSDGTRYNYEAVFTDPTVYTRPFTVTIPAKKWTAKDKPNGWHFETSLAKHAGKEPLLDREERICAENNGGFGLGAVEGKK